MKVCNYEILFLYLYKKYNMETGIYTITNLINNKMYVGSTQTTFKKRKNHHFHHLRKNTHGNRHLQHSWNKYGEANFIFEVLEECFPEYCISQETYWCRVLNLLNPNFGYNIELPQIGAFGIKRTNETKRKISEKLKGRIISKETRDKISKTTKGNKYISPKHREIISQTHKGKVVSEKSKILMSQNACKTRPWNYIKVIQYNKNMEELKKWNSIKEIVEHTNISYTAISNNLKGRSHTAGGYVFKYDS